MGATDGLGSLSPLVGAVERSLRDIADGATVLVAVSGGRDSVGLLHLVVAARPDLHVVVGHVRHGLRDDAPDAAAAQVNARSVDAGYVVADVEVGSGEGPEDAARTARWDALSTMAIDAGAVAVLVGHTMDDQAETVLLRIARGTGPTGLAGMAAWSTRDGTTVVRPLLGLRRTDVRTVAEAHTWVEDPTNVDPLQRRARARHEALAAIARLHPDDADPVPLIARLADLARQESEGLDLVADSVPLWRYGPAVVVPRHGGPATALSAVRGRLLRRAWTLLSDVGLPPPHRTVAAALDLPHGGSLTGPGGVVVTASERGWVLCPPVATPPPLILEVGGRVRLDLLGVDLTCAVATAEGPQPDVVERVVLGGPGLVGEIDPAPWHLDVAGVPPLRISWRGTAGARDARPLLQQMVPAGLRHLVPLVHDAQGRLVAVGSRPVDPPPRGTGCLRLVGYPAVP